MIDPLEVKRVILCSIPNFICSPSYNYNHLEEINREIKTTFTTLHLSSEHKPHYNRSTQHENASHDSPSRPVGSNNSIRSPCTQTSLWRRILRNVLPKLQHDRWLRRTREPPRRDRTLRHPPRSALETLPPSLLQQLRRRHSQRSRSRGKSSRGTTSRGV